MGISKTEINLRRLLAAAPHQQNQAKLLHYIGTLREQLEELAEEKTSDGIPRISKAQVNDYSEKIEAIASKLAVPVLSEGFVRLKFFFSLGNFQSTMQESEKPSDITPVGESPSKTEGESPILTSPKLRRRFVPQSNVEDRPHNHADTNNSAPVKLDAAAQTHIQKHRKLQEDLTDEMVGLAKQLKESSLVMSQSIKNTEKILDSTEEAVEHSLASTGRVNTRAMDINSKTFKTTCFTWLVMFAMTCIFIMVVLLIRIT
ncbi:hypothetical protein RHGRI_002865 [Rhododendron griersonianum]|uniref:Vesicle transport protein USE1 n=1 Tax=Rhododendron griersonianum TaxID=479676 RepID=A0AAV6LRW0_9ERIC|nr:hypothetical protein RHGRI_002865 [Rhododendron griersonianum]